MSCNNQNSAIDMVADTGSPVVSGIKDFFSIGSKNLSFGDNRKKFFFSPVTVNLSTSNRLTFVFLSYLKMSGNWQKPKRNYMAADGLTENSQGLVSF